MPWRNETGVNVHTSKYINLKKQDFEKFRKSVKLACNMNLWIAYIDCYRDYLIDVWKFAFSKRMIFFC